MIGSVDDFKNRLSEIDILIDYAQKNQHNLNRYKLFNKISVVLLCSHFEVFIEAFISEHVDALKTCYNSTNMPQYMKNNYIDDTFTTLKGLARPSSKARPLNALFKLHGDRPMRMTDISDLILNTKYSFGKHGQEETEKLLKKFGFDTFIETPIFKDSFRKINSAISIRNNIIHEGTAPTLSHADVKTYKNSFLDFADALEQHVMTDQIRYYGKEHY